MIQELDKEKIKVLEEIADINVKVLEAKGTLKQLEDDKEAFIQFRENEVSGRIHKLLNSSRILLSEVSQNYIAIHALYDTISASSDDLSKIYSDFKELVADFKEKSGLADEAIEKQEKELQENKNLVKLQSESLDRDKKFIERKKKEIEDDRRKLEDERGTLKRAIERLQKGKI